VLNVTTYVAVGSTGDKGWQRRQALHLLRAMERYAIAQGANPYNAAGGACANGQPHLQARYLWRAMQRPAIAPGAVTYNVAVNAGDRASTRSGPYICCER